ncbi:hypothetical protein KGF56_004234 [Candida oxycetoniae]|uniref:Uncharacterized protein n=1 Tax=Candida oxycetoniae TaxID=497107 RepID=A0AAI9SU91_9ASCO|nr:uncharacterized protein KGF56_004234 [Candida oxycetoniae]KAI3402981.2 hypothetical protein KGF56_004234 [Candida oxycetoniae]
MRHKFRYNIVLNDLLPHNNTNINKLNKLKGNYGEVPSLYPISAFVIVSPSPCGLENQPQFGPPSVIPNLFSPPPSSISIPPSQLNNFPHQPSQLNNFPHQPSQLNNFPLQPSQLNNFPLQPSQLNDFPLQPRVIPIIEINPGRSIPHGGLPIESLYQQYYSQLGFQSPISPLRSSDENVIDDNGIDDNGIDDNIMKEDYSSSISEHSIQSSPNASSSSSDIIIKIHPTNQSD